MNSIDFCYWLQGYFEISGAKNLNTEQTDIVKNHLNLAFKHEIDPLRNSQTNATDQQLQQIHDGNDGLMRC